jgi:predicted nucleic acid-binding protein
MADAISNTSPLLYLHRAGALDWLGTVFGEVWVPRGVVEELHTGRELGHDVPVVPGQPWLRVVNARHTPSAWLALDLGPGELGAMALALENPERIVLLDDALARRTATAAGLHVWGTLRVLLEARLAG